MTFDQFDLHPKLRVGLNAAGFTTPTPIQEQAIPAVMAGRDLMGLAQTGTGKTAAFVLPMLHRLLDGPRRQVRALIIAPTRELAEQIHDSITVLARGTGLRSATIYGGVGMQPQMRALSGRCEIIVACPGRLLDHLGRGNANLSNLEMLVLDEADHMFDMGFLPDIRRIIGQLPTKRQTLLFSATMPDAIRGLAHDVLNQPVTVEIDHTAPAKTVEHAIYPVDTNRKTDLLKHILAEHDTRSVLVFTRTKHRAKRLAEQLGREGYAATSLQGNLSQTRRQRALDGFRSGRYHILVATDIAARGIDVSRVSHVINYDMPDTADAYTHRIGRTGRAERSGEAFTLVTHEDGGMVRAIERIMGEPLTRIPIDGFAADGWEKALEQRSNGRSGRQQRQGGYRSQQKQRGHRGQRSNGRNGNDGQRRTQRERRPRADRQRSDHRARPDRSSGD